ncbi:peptidoglycan-binding protein [Methylobacterium tardum]|uniref:peptidoglycan-binding domain-containing protein n=1 Tax=Methylobacterium tardum TaxID=374432 RepID=UPI0020225697|nr:peptidoglycan-binding domain-containing protein [Methylobacterium tardum]URD34433.1 peptidoglycan-binding protein [Methylobacterium tardum]
MGRPGLGDGVRFRPPSGGDASAQGVDQATRAAQNDLRDLGFDPGTIDGRWGPRSLAALRRFQRGEGLPESGRADPDTLARLRQRSRQPSAASPIAKAPEPDATARSPLPSVGVAQVPDPDARAKESPAPTSSAQDAIDSDSPDGHTGGAKAAAPSVSGQASGESRANAPNPAAEPRSQAPGTSSQSPAPAFPLATLALVGAIVPGALLAAWGVRRRRRQLVPSTPETIDAGLRDGEPAPSTGLPREAPVGLRAARPAASNHVAVIPEPRTPMADPSPMTGLVGSTEVPAPDAVADPPADDPIEATDRSGAIDPGQDPESRRAPVRRLPRTLSSRDRRRRPTTARATRRPSPRVPRMRPRHPGHPNPRRVHRSTGLPATGRGSPPASAWPSRA